MPIMRWRLWGDEQRYAFEGAYRHAVELTVFPRKTADAGHVVLLAAFDGRLVFTRHRLRGLEWPGGKVEPGEPPLLAAYRELMEETGAEAESIWLVAQYRVRDVSGEELVKNVYAAEVRRLTGRHSGEDTDGAALVPVDVEPAAANGFSPLVCDPVFRCVRAAVLGVGRPRPLRPRK
ncbi:MAG: hypothetical protein BLM47_12620 [Candidatus Reconcilbacillus cellulovorans]|uniref:Nudix hydrolase domain-containing protein n=1 Tax=Candidatus Reconcilbacillus cellulovorans TaxID=1906605 RepID=A0A2A6DXC6_9BACL|nr:MAG: hypothetical protein BLM47_12620 [Candidatus Reconcilbacillus cellulovorans]